jgi:hypothetical protein
MFTSQNQAWTVLYKGALLELDRQKLPERIALAKKAMQERLQQFEASSDHHFERQDLADAANNLRALETEMARPLEFLCDRTTRGYSESTPEKTG